MTILDDIAKYKREEIAQAKARLPQLGLEETAKAVDAPRVHNQWYPDVIFVEQGLLTPETRSALGAMGYTFKEMTSWGADEAILVNPKTGLLEGANDRRRPAGLAAGY